jgi:hypothetical protein
LKSMMAIVTGYNVPLQWQQVSLIKSGPLKNY